MSGRLTFDRPDGTWGVAGMHEGNESDKMYAVAAKLHAYEKSGLSPSDLEDLCTYLHDHPWTIARRMERLTERNANGTYYYPECFKRCEGMVDSPCSFCDAELERCSRLGAYEDSFMMPLDVVEIASILRRAIPVKKKLTRAEAFRQLSDEQMAERILQSGSFELAECWCRVGCNEIPEDASDCGKALGCVLAWLREEVSGDEDLLQARRWPS